MAGATIDGLTSGPATEELADPAFTPWQLLRALAERGHSVRALFPDPMTGAVFPSLPPVGSVPVPTHPSEREDPHAFVRNARELLRPDVQGILRWPGGVGSVKPPKGHARVVTFVPASVLDAFDRSVPASGSVFARFGRWRDRRGVRRGEMEALTESEVIAVPRAEVGERLAELYGLDKARFHEIPDPVPAPVNAPSRDASRKQLHVPLDIELVAYVAGPGDAGTEDLALALETFRRIRVFFAGARFVAVGASGSTEPGVTYLPDRSRGSVDLALAGADVALFPRLHAANDPIPPYALSSGRATIVTPNLGWTIDRHAPFARCSSSVEAGSLASDLAELLADPALRRSLGTRAQAFTETRSVVRTAATIERYLFPETSR